MLLNRQTSGNTLLFVVDVRADIYDKVQYQIERLFVKTQNMLYNKGRYKVPMHFIFYKSTAQILFQFFSGLVWKAAMLFVKDGEFLEINLEILANHAEN